MHCPYIAKDRQSFWSHVTNTEMFLQKFGIWPAEWALTGAISNYTGKWQSPGYLDGGYTWLNSVSFQCARGKSSIAVKPEVHPKIFKW